MLGLPGVDPAVRAETELASHRAVDAADLHLEALGDLLGRKARVFALGLAGRRVFAWGFQSGVDVTIIHGSSPSAYSGPVHATRLTQPSISNGHPHRDRAANQQPATTSDARHMPLPARASGHSVTTR